MKLYIIVALVFLIGIPGHALYAVGNSYFPQDTSLVIAGAVYTITGGSDADQVVVSATTVTVTISAGESFTMTSSDKYLLANNKGYSTACTSTQSSLTILVSSGSQVVVVTPDKQTQLCSSGSTGGSSSGGGGGGGMISTPTPVPTLSSTPTPEVTASATPLPTQGESTYVPAPIPPIVSSAFHFTKRLARGSRGAEVLALQIRLKELNFFPAALAPNGNFGPATEKAVRAFQKAHGLEVVGFVGPKTRALLNSY